MKVKGNTLGARIRYVRNKMQCTGEEFGKLLNVTKVAVSNWEKDNRKPDIDMLARIANPGNVTTDFLLCKTDIENNTLYKFDSNKENLILELSKEVYPNGITREEIIEKLKIFKQLEESGIEITLKN